MKIEELRAAVNAARQKMVDAHEKIERALTVEEGQEAPDVTELRSAFDAAEAEWKQANERFERSQRLPQEIKAPEIKASEVEASVVAVREQVSVGKEEATYRPDNGTSIFRDLYRQDDPAARARLDRHRAEMRDLSSTDAAGGYLVAPLYLQNEFVNLARAGRVAVDALGARPLPPKTDSINIPTMATGVATANQADNAAVTETDATFGTIAADVKTIAGMQDVSQQLVDRSVPGIDSIIYADLLADYNVRLDTAVLTSTTANNEGLLEADNANAVTYTDASPTAGELYAKVADAIQRVHTSVYMPADAILMHPRRWAFFLAALDSSNRPLVVPSAQGPQNGMAVHGGVVSEGPVGSLQGLPVWVDPNIPTNLGSGTNEDRIIVLRRQDHFVWEDASGPFLETFRETLSGNLTVRFRLHNYWAQQHERRSGSLSIIAGTGLATPSF